MKLIIDNFSAGRAHVDRTGVAREAGGPEGFEISLGDLTIEFEDERGAVRIAKLILYRLGEIEEDVRKTTTPRVPFKFSEPQ